MERELIEIEAERVVQDAAQVLTTPRSGECLLCFVCRQLQEFGCNNQQRFILHYRDLAAPRATALQRRLWQKGGFCDCEIFLNVCRPHDELWTPGRMEIDEEGFEIWHEAQPPKVMPACGTVRRGSTQPCYNWVSRRYWGR